MSPSVWFCRLRERPPFPHGHHGCHQGSSRRDAVSIRDGWIDAVRRTKRHRIAHNAPRRQHATECAVRLPYGPHDAFGAISSSVRSTLIETNGLRNRRAANQPTKTDHAVLVGWLNDPTRPDQNGLVGCPDDPTRPAYIHRLVWSGRSIADRGDFRCLILVGSFHQHLPFRASMNSPSRLCPASGSKASRHASHQDRRQGAYNQPQRHEIVPAE